MDGPNPILDEFLSGFLDDLNDEEVPGGVSLPVRAVVVEDAEVNETAVQRLEQARRYSEFVYGSAFMSWISPTEDEALGEADLALVVEDPTTVVVHERPPTREERENYDSPEVYDTSPVETAREISDALNEEDHGEQ